MVAVRGLLLGYAPQPLQPLLAKGGIARQSAPSCPREGEREQTVDAGTHGQHENKLAETRLSPYGTKAWPSIEHTESVERSLNITPFGVAGTLHPFHLLGKGDSGRVQWL